jgi:hypothetical protein
MRPRTDRADRTQSCRDNSAEATWWISQSSSAPYIPAATSESIQWRPTSAWTAQHRREVIVYYHPSPSLPPRAQWLGLPISAACWKRKSPAFRETGQSFILDGASENPIRRAPSAYRRGGCRSILLANGVDPVAQVLQPRSQIKRKFLDDSDGPRRVAALPKPLDGGCDSVGQIDLVSWRLQQLVAELLHPAAYAAAAAS